MVRAFAGGPSRAAPHQIQSEEDGGWRLVVNGEVDESGGRLPVNEETPGRRAEDQQREADTSVDVRLAMMHIDGLNGEMVYPTIGLYVYGIDRPDVGIASCRVYNDWIHERLGDDCPRGPLRRAPPRLGHGLHGRRDPAGRPLARSRRADAPTRRQPHMEPVPLGAGVGRHRRDRPAGRDASGHWPQHDLLPRVGQPDREPAGDPVHGAVDRVAARVRRRPRAATRASTSCWSR